MGTKRLDSPIGGLIQNYLEICPPGNQIFNRMEF